KILELCEITDLPKGKRPYSTIIEVQQLRDDIVHPKVHGEIIEKEMSLTKEPPLFEPMFIEARVSREKALRIRDDIAAFAELVQSAAKARFPEALSWDFGAFDGPYRIGGSSLTAELSGQARPQRRER
ncbi:MAG: hypothetical protein JSR21_05995, partial [Proteobacteria bacterium]|nr:hypothetical protein [Pseudomonadota bacterium]